MTLNYNSQANSSMQRCVLHNFLQFYFSGFGGNVSFKQTAKSKHTKVIYQEAVLISEDNHLKRMGVFSQTLYSI